MPHRHWQSRDQSKGQSQCIVVTKRGKKGRSCARFGICTETRKSCGHPVFAKVGEVEGCWVGPNRPCGPFGFYVSEEKLLAGVCF